MPSESGLSAGNQYRLTVINMQPIARRFPHVAAVVFFCCLFSSCATENAVVKMRSVENQIQQAALPFHWDEDFKVVNIESSADENLQKAYFHGTGSARPQPLFVHLHTWSNDYSKPDLLAGMVRDRDWNYIHPNFRGRNNTPESCCSELAIQDIDDAIAYALRQPNVDASKIYVAGYSGGGMATLCTFMKSRHRIKSFSSWVPISDLEAWYLQSKGRGNKYAGEILQVTGSDGDSLNVEEARNRSPLYMEVPVEKLAHASLKIYAGIHDGYTGSVPITQSIKMYNKIVGEMGIEDPAAIASIDDMLWMLETRSAPRPDENLGYLADRKIHFKKEVGNLQLVIFEGGHEPIRSAIFTEIVD